MPSNTTWNPFVSTRHSNGRSYDEERAADKEDAVEKDDKNRTLVDVKTSLPHQLQTQTHHASNSFHRDTFSTRMTSFYETPPKANGKIMFGHKIALKHLRSGKFLHADKEHSLEGSGSYSVNLHKWKPRDEDYWLVLPQLGQTQFMGKPIHYGRSIRLQHIVTRSNLHSHQPVESPSQPAELDVSLFPDVRSDSDDVWSVDVFNFTPRSKGASSKGTLPALNHDKNSMQPGDFWHADDIVLFRHKVTQHYLTGRPEAFVDKKQMLTKVVAGSQCELEGAWRVAVPGSDDEEALTATMDEPDMIKKFTVEEAYATDKTEELLE